MAKKLVIVESPAKAKTIAKILGAEYVVKSSVGHVRDLPERRLGVDIEHGFEPHYEVSKGKTKVIQEIKKAAKDCDTIYLAPDPDREGEAIAWHLRQLLEEEKTPRRFARVQYNEITPGAVAAAFKNPGEIDQPRVDAQQARRILDRIVGYMVSPMLWRRIQRNLSAGRVQSVALRMVCERERRITEFKPEAYWLLGAMVRKTLAPFDPFRLRLKSIDGKKADLRSEDRVRQILEDLRGVSLRVTGIHTRQVNKRPPPPFITSTLQQAASSYCGFSPGRTMRLAQRLYEGLDLGRGAIGLITYMRTDSVNVSADARTAARDYVEKHFGKEFVPEKPNVYKGRAGAQEAHEAIRPTDIALSPDKLPKSVGAPERKLYDLIWRRFMASQMTPARYEQRRIDVEGAPSETRAPDAPASPAYGFGASASVLVFPGYTRVSQPATSGPAKNESRDEDSDVVDNLPPLTEGEPLVCLEWLSERKETKPPPRFSEASLVRALEAKGIGRPSTYAGIIETLNQRNYIEREKRMLLPSELGVRVNDLLVDKLPRLFDVNFTAEMEAMLDRVEKGELAWRKMLEAFYRDFQVWLEEAREPAADEQVVADALELLGRVRDWAPAYKRGRRTFSDQKFVESISEQARTGRHGVSPRQLEALMRLLARYSDQIDGAAAFLKKHGRAEFLEAPELQPPRDVTHRKLEILAGLELAEPDRDFVNSLAEQVKAGRRLTEAQTAALDSVLRGARAQIEDFERLRRELGIDPPDEAAEGECRDLLEALETVSEWREPTRRGKREFNDRAFFESLRSQFARRRALSPRQRSALRRMVAQYRGQVTNYESLAAKYGIQEPRGKSGKPPKSGKNASEDKAAPR